MKSAVIINLDYEHHSVQVCRAVWDEIVLRMESAGFSRFLPTSVAAMSRGCALAAVASCACRTTGIALLVGVRASVAKLSSGTSGLVSG